MSLLELPQLYEAHFDTRRSLLAKDYGALATTLLAVASSTFSSDLVLAIRRARVRHQRELGYKLYTDLAPCSFVERLSLPELVVTRPGITSEVEIHTVVCVAAEAIGEAYEYVQDFSVCPERAKQLVRADYLLFLAWLAALNRLGYAVTNAGLHALLFLELRDGQMSSYKLCVALMRSKVYHECLL